MGKAVIHGLPVQIPQIMLYNYYFTPRASLPLMSNSSPLDKATFAVNVDKTLVQLLTFAS